MDFFPLPLYHALPVMSLFIVGFKGFVMIIAHLPKRNALVNDALQVHRNFPCWGIAFDAGLCYNILRWLIWG
jgi:hypothetical protein